jgi:hypothetical protein
MTIFGLNKKEVMNEILTRLLVVFLASLVAWGLLWYIATPIGYWDAFRWSFIYISKFLATLFLGVCAALNVVMFVVWDRFLTKEKSSEGLDDLL